MRIRRGAIAAMTLLAPLALPGAALAQRASENAVTDADDAFGTTVGLETSGIYSENDTRGFSPLKAGNSRIEGVYFDQVVPLSGRLRQGNAIRVGFSALDFPFVAPTGIVDNKFRGFPTEFGNSMGASQFGYDGTIFDWDARIPLIKDHLSLTGGLAYADVRSFDGSNTESWGMALRPIARLGGAEIAPFAAIGRYLDALPHTLVVASGANLPKLPPRRYYLGQKWAKLKAHHENYGTTLKLPLTGGLSLRAGMFHAVGNRLTNFTELFSIQDANGLASHRMIADPAQDVHSTSGEAMLALRLGQGDWQHRFFAGYRARDRYTETGGSDIRDFGTVTYGQRDPEAKPAFRFTEVNRARLRQSSWMLGYAGKLGGAAQLNLGIQKGRYRARSRHGGTTETSRSRDNPWLYNAMALVNLTPAFALYAGTEKGLEDSGTAPENATNRNDQLPATRTTQYEGGVRWKFHGGQLVVNAFQLTRPYFSFDPTGTFVELGHQRHRGVEASFSGHLSDRFSVVAGGFVMQPRVVGAAVAAGLVGRRPAGAPSAYARVDLNYRTDWLGGVTPTAALVYTGRRAVSSRPLAALGNHQLMLPGVATVDVGFRHHFRVGAVDASLRANVNNVFDKATWKVVGPNVLWPEERRRYTVYLTTDF